MFVALLLLLSISERKNVIRAVVLGTSLAFVHAVSVTKVYPRVESVIGEDIQRVSVGTWPQMPCRRCEVYRVGHVVCVAIKLRLVVVFLKVVYSQETLTDVVPQNGGGKPPLVRNPTSQQVTRKE